MVHDMTSYLISDIKFPKLYEDVKAEYNIQETLTTTAMR